MSLVVDTSVIISVITNEKSKPKLIKMTEDEDLIAPSSVHWEVGNAFSAMFKRGEIDLVLARMAIDLYKKIPLRLAEVDIDRSLELAYKYNIYADDAYFLECSRKYGLPLITLDNHLVEVAKKMNIKIIEV